MLSHWLCGFSRPPPRRIALAEPILYCAILIWTFRLFLEQIDSWRPGQLAISIGFLCAQSILIRVAICERNYRACWCLLAFFFIRLMVWLLSDALGSSSPMWRPPDLPILFLRSIQAVAEVIGLSMIFSRPGRRWLNRYRHRANS